jgi:hypothetical protein
MPMQHYGQSFRKVCKAKMQGKSGRDRKAHRLLHPQHIIGFQEHHLVPVETW